jgi:type IV secretion system protein VirB3
MGRASEGEAVALARDPLFVALTRPQMFAGVTYSFFVINLVIATEAFLIFRSAWALALALVVHGAGWLACLREPRVFDLWLVRASRCPRVKNYRFWRCNSYAP